MSQISISGRCANMTSPQADDVSVSKGTEGWEEALSLAGAHVRQDNIKSPVCPYYDEFHDGNTKRLREEQVSYYPFSTPNMTNPYSLSGEDMLFFYYHTSPARTGEPPCTVDGYISNHGGVEWLDAAWFATVEEGPQRVKRHGYFMLHHGSWMMRWRHWAAVSRSLRVSVVAVMY